MGVFVGGIYVISQFKSVKLASLNWLEAGKDPDKQQENFVISKEERWWEFKGISQPDFGKEMRFMLQSKKRNTLEETFKDEKKALQ